MTWIVWLASTIVILFAVMAIVLWLDSLMGDIEGRDDWK
jgi:hypothetical protein